MFKKNDQMTFKINLFDNNIEIQLNIQIIDHHHLETSRSRG